MNANILSRLSPTGTCSRRATNLCSNGFGHISRTWRVSINEDTTDILILDGIFLEINHPAIGVPPIYGTPHIKMTQ